MVRTRNQYHYAVRRLKKMSNSIRSRQLLQASEEGSVKLLAEMKKIKGSKKGSDSLPDSVGGVSGEDSIVEEFRQVYSHLYNSSGTQEAMEVLKDELGAEIGRDSIAEANKITGAIVKEAACRMKPSKGDVSGSYTSDALLNAPDKFFELIAPVFKSWLVHGTVTLSLLACAFLPLFKGGLKDPAKTDSYRAIAGSSLLLKLFDNVVLLLWGDFLSSDSLQFGFKSGTSTTQCSWMVQEVASYYLRRGTPCIVTLLDCSKAFDMCEFLALFQKLRKRKVPSIVLRTLIFVYEQQSAWVRWGNAKSDCFSITNGTRQGSVLSPAFFSVYIDDLLVKLRQLGVGCHIGDMFFGAAGFADDLILLAPCRKAMEMMLELCENFAKDNNLQFSTDTNPAKSKSKCIYMCGKLNNVSYPVHLQLYGVDLPWVTHATHLGHELHQLCTMEFDAKLKRADFIRSSTDIREQFGFAHPRQILQAVGTYSAHFYGAMLWDLFGEMAGQSYRAWNTCVKLAWGVPRWTHNFFVEHVLSDNLPSVRKKVLGQYIGFFNKLLSSKSREIVMLANIVGREMGSVTGKNLFNIENEFGLDPWQCSSLELKKVYSYYMVPEADKWRLPFLVKLLDQRIDMDACGEKTKAVSELIESLSSN